MGERIDPTSAVQSCAHCRGFGCHFCDGRGIVHPNQAYPLSGHLDAPTCTPPLNPSQWRAGFGVELPRGWRRVESAGVYVHEATGRVIVAAFPGELWCEGSEGHEDDDSPHNCDAMGCRAAHVVLRGDLEGPPWLPPSEVQDE